MRYNWKKAGVQAFMAFSGCTLSHIITTAEGMPPTSLMFWKHVFFVALVTSFISEMTYLREWGKQFLGGDATP